MLILSFCPPCAFGKEIFPFAGTSKLPQMRFLSLDDDDMMMMVAVLSSYNFFVNCSGLCFQYPMSYSLLCDVERYRHCP